MGRDPQAKLASNERRLQRFFADFKLDLDAFARLLLTLVPADGRLVVTLDRTHWQVGQAHLNVLLFGIAHDGVSFPILWTLLGKAGNSNQAERQKLLARLLDIVPARRIEAVVADREFIGDDWLEALATADLPFVIRIRKNARVTSRGRTRSAGAWIHRFTPGTVVARRQRVYVYDRKLFLTSLRRRNDDGDVIVLSNQRFADALAVYAERWSIETLFQSLKSRALSARMFVAGSSRPFRESRADLREYD